MNQYHEIPTHMSVSEKNKLRELSHSIKEYNPTMVEIGSYLGASTCFLATGLLGFNCSGKIHAVDTWMNDAMNNIPKQDVFTEFLNNTKGFVNIVPHRGLSVDVAATFTESIDMIFFDGDHGEAVYKDWEVWSPKLKENAIVVFHDWDWAESVKSLILNEVHPKVKYFDTLPNMWIGWL